MFKKFKELIACEIKNFLDQRKLVNGVEKAYKMTQGALNLEEMETYLQSDKKNNPYFINHYCYLLLLNYKVNLKIGLNSHVNSSNETYIEEYIHRKYLNVFQQLIKQKADPYWNGSTKINLDVHGTPLFNLLEQKRLFDESQGKTNVFKLFEYNVDDNLSEDKIKLLSEVFEAFTENLNLEQFQTIINDHIYHKDLYEKILTNKQKVELLQNNTNTQKNKNLVL